MVNMQANLAVRIERVRVASPSAAPLTSEPVTFQNLVSQLWRDCPRDGRLLFKVFKYILARFQVCAVNMALDLKPFFVPQLADSSGVLTDASHFANLLRCQYFPDVRNEERAYSISCTHIHLAMKTDNRLCRRSRSFVWHCQTTDTLQPAFRKRRRSCASRLMFPSIFLFQNVLFVCGLVAREHAACPCQKHPLTKMSLRYPRITRSGLPGIAGTLPRKRQCKRLRHFLTMRSGDVFRPLTLAII